MRAEIERAAANQRLFETTAGELRENLKAFGYENTDSLPVVRVKGLVNRLPNAVQFTDTEAGVAFIWVPRPNPHWDLDDGERKIGLFARIGDELKKCSDLAELHAFAETAQHRALLSSPPSSEPRLTFFGLFKNFRDLFR